MSRLPALIASVLLVCLQHGALAADIYGYIDDKGMAHFASEKLDARYQLFFKGGQSFDTADGIGAPGRRGSGKVPAVSQSLVAMFEKSPSYRVAKAALQDASKRHAIDYELLQALVATESGFDAQALSPKGAMGLMQVMPTTAERYGVQGDKRRSIEDKLYDPRINIATGSRYLRDLIAMFPGQIELALAAYNAGEGAVQRAGNKVPNYRETQDYVQTVLQLYAYLKPGTGVAAARGGKTPGRVRMEMVVPKGGALGRGNMPPDSGSAPAMPAWPEQPAAPARPLEAPAS